MFIKTTGAEEYTLDDMNTILKNRLPKIWGAKSPGFNTSAIRFLDRSDCYYPEEVSFLLFIYRINLELITLSTSWLKFKARVGKPVNCAPQINKIHKGIL